MTTRNDSLISVTTDTVTNAVRGTGTVTDNVIGTLVHLSSITQRTAEFADVANMAWVAEGMANFDDTQRKYIELVSPDTKLPPVIGTPTD